MVTAPYHLKIARLKAQSARRPDAAARLPSPRAKARTSSPEQAVSDTAVKEWDDDANRLHTRDNEAKLKALEGK